jgi:small nuclear ribonucleoprotein (snRNP)-like protein
MKNTFENKFEFNADFFDKFQGKRVEIHCTDGKLLRGRVGELERNDGFNFDLDAVEVEAEHAGETPCYNIVIPESQVKSVSLIEN